MSIHSPLSRGASFLLLVIAGLAPTGCTILAKTDAEQCMVNADCAARGPEFAGLVCTNNTCQTPPDPIWGCVGHVAPPTTAPFTSTILVQDAISLMPVTNASVKLCARLDPTCMEPLQTPTLAADGTTQVTIASNTNDYYLIESPDYLPTRYFIDTGGITTAATVSLISPAVQTYLNNTLGITADPAAGSINISMSDCMHVKAKGVHFDLDPKGNSLAYYSIASVISPTATATDPVGNGGFINAPAGGATLTATLEDTGETIGVVTTLVVAGSLTFQPMRPTPL